MLSPSVPLEPPSSSVRTPRTPRPNFGRKIVIASGERVLVNEVPAIVLDVTNDGEYIDVQYFDGSVSHGVHLSDVQYGSTILNPYQIGQTCEATFRSSTNFHPAKIIHINADSTFDLSFGDDLIEYNVEVSRMRPFKKLANMVGLDVAGFKKISSNDNNNDNDHYKDTMHNNSLNMRNGQNNDTYRSNVAMDNDSMDDIDEFKVEEGDLVDAHVGGDKWVRGVVLHCRSSGFHSIRFENGVLDHRVPIQVLRIAKKWLKRDLIGEVDDEEAQLDEKKETLHTMQELILTALAGMQNKTGNDTRRLENYVSELQSVIETVKDEVANSQLASSSAISAALEAKDAAKGALNSAQNVLQKTTAMADAAATLAQREVTLEEQLKEQLKENSKPLNFDEAEAVWVRYLGRLEARNQDGSYRIRLATGAIDTHVIKQDIVLAQERYNEKFYREERGQGHGKGLEGCTLHTDKDVELAEQIEDLKKERDQLLQEKEVRDRAEDKVLRRYSRAVDAGVDFSHRGNHGHAVHSTKRHDSDAHNIYHPSNGTHHSSPHTSPRKGHDHGHTNHTNHSHAKKEHIPDYSSVEPKVPSHIVPATHGNAHHAKEAHNNHHNHPQEITERSQRPTISMGEFLSKHEDDDGPATTTTTTTTINNTITESASSDIHHARPDHEHDSHPDLSLGHSEEYADVSATANVVEAAKKPVLKKRKSSVRRASIKDTKAGINAANAKMTKKKVATRMSEQEAREVHKSTRKTVHTALAGVIGTLGVGVNPSPNDDGNAEEGPASDLSLFGSPYVEREARRQSILNIQNKAAGGRVPFDSNVISVSDPIKVQSVRGKLEKKLTIVELPETDLSGIVAGYRNSIGQIDNEESEDDNDDDEE